MVGLVVDSSSDTSSNEPYRWWKMKDAYSFCELRVWELEGVVSRLGAKQHGHSTRCHIHREYQPNPRQSFPKCWSVSHARRALGIDSKPGRRNNRGMRRSKPSKFRSNRRDHHRVLWIKLMILAWSTKINFVVVTSNFGFSDWADTEDKWIRVGSGIIVKGTILGVPGWCWCDCDNANGIRIYDSIRKGL